MKIKKFLCVAAVLSLLASSAGCAAENVSRTIASDYKGTEGVTAGYGSEATGYGSETAGSRSAAADGEAYGDDKTKGEVFNALEAPLTEDRKSLDLAVDGDTAYPDYPDEIFDDGDLYPDITDSPSEPSVQLPQFGQLTAGEWRDNDNWGFFTNLVTSGTISYPSFSLDPRDRYMITVKGDDGKPAANVRAVLEDGEGKILWSAVTDHNGKAYLFVTNSSETAERVTLSVGDKNETYPIRKSQTEIMPVETQEQQGQTKTDPQAQKQNVGTTEMELTFAPGGRTEKKTEIMFIIDSTGSMSDEMLYLQSEFSSIARDVGIENTQYSVNFYRDKGDTYITKCNPFTSDISEVQRILTNERADGGGDTPEAIAQILTETLIDGGWSENSVKLAFMIYDAPPHDEGTDAIEPR